MRKKMKMNKKIERGQCNYLMLLQNMASKWYKTLLKASSKSLNLGYILSKFQLFLDCRFHQKLNCHKVVI